MVQKVLFGPLKSSNQNLSDLTVRETIALAPMVALVFVIGFFPKLFLSPMTESVTSVIEHYRDGRSAYLATDVESKTVVLLPRRGGPLEVGYPEAPGGTSPVVGMKPPAEPKPSEAQGEAQ
jgi:NADH-quinone oxidoreductase subunit M